jgi:cytochrome oxidase Cu insertion factor (SCO1/SenC/PrrC family)
VYATQRAAIGVRAGPTARAYSASASRLLAFVTGQMEYLIGTFKELAPVWRAYGVQVQASPGKRESSVGHSAFVYGITGSGSVRVLYPPTLEPAWIAHDVPLLASA